MIARIAAPLLLAAAIVACASIDSPAAFTPAEGGVDPSAPDGSTCSRVLPRAFTSNVTAKLYGAPGGAQAVCMTLEVLSVPNAGPGIVTFCVAGDLETASVGTPRDIDFDTRTCAYCIDVRTNCRSAPDAGLIAPCDTSYAPVSGKMRILRLGKAAGEEIWIDVGAMTLARVRERTDAGTFVLEPIDVDCLAADGFTFRGTLATATCTDDTIECQIANSAAGRIP